MGHPKELGKAQLGYYADMILVDGNPFKDTEILQDTSKLHVPIINGHIHKNVAVSGAEGRSLPADNNKWKVYNNLLLVSEQKK